MEGKEYKELEEQLKVEVPQSPEPKPMAKTELKTRPATDLDTEEETKKKLEFVRKHNELVMEYGYDFLVRILPPELIKVEFNKQEKI